MEVLGLWVCVPSMSCGDDVGGDEGPGAGADADADVEEETLIPPPPVRTRPLSGRLSGKSRTGGRVRGDGDVPEGKS